MHLFQLKSLTICRKFTETWSIIFWKFHEKFRCRFLARFSLNCPLFYIPLTFREFSETFQTTFRRFYCGFTMKLLLTNCQSHTEDIRTLVFVRTSVHSVRTLKLRSENFALWTSQLVNKSIGLLGERDWVQMKIIGLN